MAADWYCERVFQNQKHMFTSRKSCQDNLGLDQKKRDTWAQKREELITRRTTGKAAKREGGLRKKTLKTRTARQSRLLMPGAKFWPIKLYTDTFGDPKLPQNKARGHRTSKMGKFRGVVVPGEEADFTKPLDLEVGYMDELALENELDVQGQGKRIFAFRVQKAPLVNASPGGFTGAPLDPRANPFAITLGGPGQPRWFRLRKRA